MENKRSPHFLPTCYHTVILHSNAVPPCPESERSDCIVSQWQHCSLEGGLAWKWGGLDASQADVSVSARTLCQGVTGHNQMDCSPVGRTPVRLSGKHRNILSSPAKPCQVPVLVIASWAPRGSHPYFFIEKM